VPVSARRKDVLLAIMLFLTECVTVLMAHGWALALMGPLDDSESLPFCLILMGCWWAAACRMSLWSFHKLLDHTGLMSAMAQTLGCWSVISVGIMYLFQAKGVEAEYLAVLAALGLGGILVLRLVWQTGIWCAHILGFARRRVLIIGADARAEQLVRSLLRKGYSVEGVLDDRATRAQHWRVPYLGPVSAFASVAAAHHIDDMYISLTVGNQYLTVERIVQFAETHGLVVHILGEIFQLRWAHNVPQYVADVPVLALTSVPEDRFSLAAKRVVDFVGASVLLVLLSPGFALVAVLIKLDSKGPVFFAQERVGQNQRRFHMLKFRSMVPNAEQIRDSLQALNEASGPVFKMKSDPRITRFGAFLRKHSIDEFPQLINVWRGEMSLVGPRPPLPQEVSCYTWDQRRRLSVKPGMTGLWQVSGRNAIDFEDWVKLDLQYIDRWTLTLDFWILLKTFREVVQGRNAA